MAHGSALTVGIFTPTFLPRVGGAEVVVDALARQFQDFGHTPRVIAPRTDSANDTHDEALPYAVDRYRKPIWQQWKPERLSRTLCRLHRRHQFDVILALYGQPTGYAAICARPKNNVPVVLRCPGGDVYREGKTRQKPHRWRRVVSAYKQADAVVAISDYTWQLLAPLISDTGKIHRIPNGIDSVAITAPADQPRDFVEDRPFALCLGNLIPQKGFDDAIKAFAAARRDLDDLQLVIVGDGKQREALEREASNCGVADSVHFLGQRTGNDKRWLLQNCAFGVMPSREEAFGVVALEFLAANQPLICTTNPAFDNTCVHGVNGLRVPPCDREALSRAMAECWHATWPELKTHNQQRLEHFTWPAIAERYLNLFYAAIEKRSTARA